MKVCTVEGCGARLHCHGYCAKHAAKFRKYGNPTECRHAEPGKPIEWLTAVVSDPPTECAIWPFGRGRHGYGVIQHEGKTRTAHRASLILYTGEDKLRMDVAHGECHNRLCVNPLHLRWATRLENVQDMRRDNTLLVGEKNKFCRIPDSDFVEIQKIDKRNENLILETANRYGVSTEYVRRIINGNTKRRVGAL